MKSIGPSFRVLPIDINGGHRIFGVSCALCVFQKISDKTSAIVLKNIVLNRLHHKESAELLIGLENVLQITQDECVSSPAASNYGDGDMMKNAMSDEVTKTLAAAGPIGMAAAAAIASSKKRKRPHSFETNPSPNTSYRVFGAKPLEDVVRNLRCMIMEELENALAQQAPPPPADDPSLFELPPLIIDGIPTPVEKMTQAQLRAFIPLMLKYSM
ncbi:putative DNA-binding protein Ewg, partial [Operophtera brumata]